MLENSSKHPHSMNHVNLLPRKGMTQETKNHDPKKTIALSSNHEVLFLTNPDACHNDVWHSHGALHKACTVLLYTHLIALRRRMTQCK